jgi:hypothetical protein
MTDNTMSKIKKTKGQKRSTKHTHKTNIVCVTNDHGYVPLVVNTSWPFPHSWLITGFVSKLTRRVSLVAQELLTLPKHLFSPQVGFVLLDLSFMCMFCRSFLSVCLFYFGHCVVCPSSIYGFWLPLWYFQFYDKHLHIVNQSINHICIFINWKSCILLKKTLRITHEPH